MSFRRRLGELGVKRLVNTKVRGITDAGVAVTTDGKEQVLEADTVVIALGMEANKKLSEELRAAATTQEIHAIGDCVAPRKVVVAIHDGFRVGNAI